ncbi:MAG: lactate utilization protein [Ruminococcaceae bacterium]|nr:lactate utilization protein [Oscillospiraceae bacterium]
MELKKEYYAKIAQNMMSCLTKRQMEAYYCKDEKAACNQILSLITEGASIGWGGSQTLKQIGVMDALHAGNYHLLNRDAGTNSAERSNIYAQIESADVFLTGTNAITRDGILLNMDGRSDRVCFLCHGPQSVIIAAGMNKVVTDVDDGLKRIWNVAAPLNAMKNQRKTPCAITGTCAHCQANDCICSNLVITRRSPYKNRIKIVLIGTDLGF